MMPLFRTIHSLNNYPQRFKKMRISLFIPLALAANTAFAQQVQLKTAADSASYAFGVAVGTNIARQIPDGFNNDLVMKALNDAMSNKPTLMDPMAAQNYFTEYTQQQQALEGAKGKAEGMAFLEKNKSRPGVKSTPSGLQYEVMRKGKGGPSPAATDKVTVHYHGTNTDGSVFDSSVDRGQPATFGLNQVIKGWTEGLQLMQVGDKFKFFIPAELAYGERSPSPKIKPNSTLVFEVDLLSIEGK
jgi:FKBP-type peptidyl-prolyl cis-trans isomerase